MNTAKLLASVASRSDMTPPERTQSSVTDEMVERLAVHLVNQYRAMSNTEPTSSLKEFSDFARAEWTGNARKLLLIAFGEEESPYA